MSATLLLLVVTVIGRTVSWFSVSVQGGQKVTPIIIAMT